jgi:ubiquinone biosynthesis protein UbiJ
LAPDGCIAAPAPDAELEVSISLPAAAPLLALQGKDAVMRAARIEGSAEFAEALGFVIRNLRWDAEEDLSKMVGDIAAHRIVKGSRNSPPGNSRRRRISPPTWPSTSPKSSP